MQKSTWPENRKQKYWWLYLAGWEAHITPLSIGGALVVATIYATSNHNWGGTLIVFLVVFLIIYVAATASSVWKESYRLRYDPRLALEYNRVFFDEMKEEREGGTKQAIGYIGDPNSIKEFSDADAIIDFIDDIGFLVQGHQISDWVGYHFFFHWIQIYYESFEPYITSSRRNNPAVWEYVKPLYDDLVVIEAHKSKIAKEKVPLEKAELVRRLRAELGES